MSDKYQGKPAECRFPAKMKIDCMYMGVFILAGNLTQGQ